MRRVGPGAVEGPAHGQERVPDRLRLEPPSAELPEEGVGGIDRQVRRVIPGGEPVGAGVHDQAVD